MKKTNQDCCQRKHGKCMSIVKFILGAGVLSILVHTAHNWLSSYKEYALEDFNSHSNEDIGSEYAYYAD